MISEGLEMGSEKSAGGKREEEGGEGGAESSVQSSLCSVESFSSPGFSMVVIVKARTTPTVTT